MSNIMIENSWEELPKEEIGQFESNDGSTPQFPGLVSSSSNRDASSNPESSGPNTTSTEVVRSAEEGATSISPEDSSPLTGKKFDLYGAERGFGVETKAAIICFSRIARASSRKMKTEFASSTLEFLITPETREIIAYL